VNFLGVGLTYVTRIEFFPALCVHVRICVLAQRQWQGMFMWRESAQFADPKYDQIQVRFTSAAARYPLIGEFFDGKTTD